MFFFAFISITNKNLLENRDSIGICLIINEKLGIKRHFIFICWRWCSLRKLHQVQLQQGWLPLVHIGCSSFGRRCLRRPGLLAPFVTAFLPFSFPLWPVGPNRHWGRVPAAYTSGTWAVCCMAWGGPPHWALHWDSGTATLFHMADVLVVRMC